MRYAAALLGCALAGCAPALKDVKTSLSAADAGTISFATAGSVVRRDANLLGVAPDRIALSGELTFPVGTGPFPAVVLAHGCSGPGYGDAKWAITLRDWGYATFVIDSFAGRGLREVCTNAQTLGGQQRIPDAYGALRFLATHPRIDARRIALMGFSHGGILAVGASTTWARDTFAAGEAGFRAIFAFYPFCNTDYPERQTIYAPLRIHTGASDDWTPAKPCAELVASLRASGQNAAIDIYPDGHHGFDYPVASAGYRPSVQNYAGCFWKAASILGPYLGVPDRSCIKRGATVGHHAEAAKLAEANVRAQLLDLLKRE
jgi:dienelactone hydrolase